jgi:hypothetical protein
LRGGIYTLAGELISDSHELTFDLASDNPREREMPVRFVLSRKADEANGQQVVLRLEEPVEGTSHLPLQVAALHNSPVVHQRLRFLRTRLI